ncbi:GTP-binding protein [Leptolyngbya sp. NK1-12]|nr:GTP-binding protein [Leptolyngbya sp. NK1-12]
MLFQLGPILPMRRVRLITIAASVLITLALAAWLFDSLQRLYWSLAVVSPVLASLLLALLVAALIAAIAALIYYLYLFGRPKPPARPLPPLPEDKTIVAQETLNALQQQIAQIQDEVARQALQERSRAIQQDLVQRDLQVVVFGTGSAGKTSLINAIFGEIVGEVGAAMGTTTLGETYRLHLQGLEREIVLVDTPGILEAGGLGSEREQLARQIATDADLLLFVLDNDLRQSEYQVLQMLAEIGKRLLVVFNKTDLYPAVDQQQILERLHQRFQGLILPQDLVAVAANPQAVRLPDGPVVQPAPDISSLLQRMAEVLWAEGEDLIADNILLQSQRLGEEARRLIDAERQRQAEKIVDRFQWIGAGVVAATPLPVVDLLATAAINAQMVVELGRVYGCEMNLDRGRELALSLAKTLVSLGVVRGAIEIFSVALQTNVATFLVGRAIQGVTAAYLTRIAGKSFIEYFRQNQQWGDGGMTEVVQEQFRLNRRDEFVKAFLQEAVTRVVNPLSRAERPIDPLP